MVAMAERRKRAEGGMDRNESGLCEKKEQGGKGKQGDVVCPRRGIFFRERG